MFDVAQLALVTTLVLPIVSARPKTASSGGKVVVCYQVVG